MGTPCSRVHTKVFFFFQVQKNQIKMARCLSLILFNHLVNSIWHPDNLAYGRTFSSFDWQMSDVRLLYWALEEWLGCFIIIICPTAYSVGSSWGGSDSLADFQMVVWMCALWTFCSNASWWKWLEFRCFWELQLTILHDHTSIRACDILFLLLEP
jgi:hypothetical protein